jgi:hypothetical protein
VQDRSQGICRRVRRQTPRVTFAKCRPTRCDDMLGDARVDEEQIVGEGGAVAGMDGRDGMHNAAVERDVR